MDFIKRIAKKSRVITAILAFFALLQGIVGESKWQYYPLYALAVFYLILLSLSFFNNFTISLRLSRWMVGLSLFLIAVSIFSVKAFPVPEMLEPTGDFEVGTQIYELEDETRLELYNEEAGEKRRIKYQMWYPASTTEGFEQAKWLSNGTLVPRTLLKHTLLPAPPFILDQTAQVDANAFIDAPLKKRSEPYPVVLISHGWRGFRELHTDFAEDLASHGYVVLSIDHTYGSEAVQFDDGKVAYLEPKALPRVAKPSTFQKKAHQLAVTYGEDVKLVLDELDQLNKEDAQFKGKLDMKRIGLLGHSTGGAGDVYTGLRDDRVHALIGLDAWVNPLELSVLEEGLRMPALFLRSEQWAKRESKHPLNVLVDHSDDAAIIEMAGTKHLDFPMIYMLSPYTKQVGLTGEKGGRESSIIQRDIIRIFFDQALRGQTPETDLDDYLEPYDYLRLRKSIEDTGM